MHMGVPSGSSRCSTRNANSNKPKNFSVLDCFVYGYCRSGTFSTTVEHS